MAMVTMKHLTGHRRCTSIAQRMRFYSSCSSQNKRFIQTTLQEHGNIPAIPATPISYSAAKKLFDLMDGPLAPKTFQGDLKDVQYRLDSSKEVTLTVNVRALFYRVLSISNVDPL